MHDEDVGIHRPSGHVMRDVGSKPSYGSKAGIEVRADDIV